MRIDAMNQVSQLYRPNRTKKANTENKASFADRLELSQMGKDMQVAKASVSAAPDVREDRIQEIMNAMSAGTWKVSNEQIADKMLDSFEI